MIEVQIRSDALASGFAAVGIARVRDVPDGLSLRLSAFLGEGLHGEMTWLAAHADRRGHPSRLWPDAKSAVMLAMSYAPEADPLAVLAERHRGAISVYAQGKDYHDVVKPRLKEVARRLARATAAEVKVFVDTAPLMEKPLAALAGIGWQGKHTNVVSRAHGSWLFLGAILTTAELAPDPPSRDSCGSCRRCLDICPTGALPTPYRLDARRCISYLTIEHKGPIDRELRAPIGNRIYGCDDCLAVCPWNKFARAAREARFKGGPGTSSPDLAELLDLDDRAFRRRFAGTAVKRTGRDRFLRNVLIASGNSGLAELVPKVARCAADASPLVRGAAVWALGRLLAKERMRELAERSLPAEMDETVRAEWRQELAA